MLLKNYLDSKGIKYNKVAEDLHIHYTYFLNILHVKRFPSVKLAYLIEDYTKGEIKWHDLIQPRKLKKNL